jgi:hypothetical protein
LAVPVLGGLHHQHIRVRVSDRHNDLAQASLTKRMPARVIASAEAPAKTVPGLDAQESRFSLIVEVRPPPHMKATRMSMPQGSVIGTHHEIKLVTQDVRAPSLSWRQIASCQTAATCCVAAGIPVGA